MITLEERLAKAAELRRRGYNCAQSVVMAFGDITGLDEAMAAKMTSALGTGVAATREICGVANGMAIVIGMTHGAEPMEKVAAAREANPVLRAFAEANDGRIRCAELKVPGAIRPCDELVLQGVEMLDRHFREKA